MNIFKNIGAIVFIISFFACLALGLMAMMVKAAEREDLMRDSIRQERCASFGEKVPSYMKDYCKNLGV
ncbi:MAG: hypothetical protein AB7G80_09190 [Dongiaceae bacterium]